MLKSGTNMVYEYPENSKAIRLKQHEAALAAAKEDDKLSPETGKPISKSNMIKFGVAFLVFGVLWMVGINAIAAFIIPLRLKELVSNPAAVLSINGIVSSICSLVANFVFGNLSDRTRSKFGGRTPWLIVGSIVGGVFMFLTGIAPNATLIVISMSACYGAGSTIGGPLGTLLASQLVNNVTLSSILAGLFMLASGIVVVLIIPREPSADYLPKPKGDWKDLLVSFRPPKFKENHDFYKAFAGRLCMLMAYQMIVAYQLYIVTDYVGLKTGPAAQVISIMSIITMVVSLIGPAISGPLSDITGRRKLPVLIASILFALGIAFPWFFPSAMGMYAYAAIAGLGYGVYSSVDQALNVDVLHNSPSAGKDLGFLNLATTIGQMLGPVVTASIVTATGGYALAFTVSIVAAVLGSVFVMGIKGVK